MLPVATLLYVHEIYLHYMSLCVFRSVFGGQTVEITGNGFGTDTSAVDVSFGHCNCSVNDTTDTMITCTTESTAMVHYVNNSGLVLKCAYIISPTCINPLWGGDWIASF